VHSCGEQPWRSREPLAQAAVRWRSAPGSLPRWSPGWSTVRGRRGWRTLRRRTTSHW